MKPTWAIAGSGGCRSEVVAPASSRASFSRDSLGDTLYVTDGRQLRVSFFSGDGTLYQSIRLTSPQVGRRLLPSVPFRLLGDGTALVSPGFIASAGAEGAVPHIPYLRISRTGEVVDTVAWQPRSNSQLSFSRGSREFFTSQPFNDDPFVVFDPDGRSFVFIERGAAETGRDAEFRVTRIIAPAERSARTPIATNRSRCRGPPWTASSRNASAAS